jgi:hypothetical protein
MATLADIEAALVASWDLEHLTVYGDYLQVQGDFRGELVALDLRVATSGPSAALADRKRELVEQWLGEDLATIIAHAGAIRYAFVELGYRATEMAAFALEALLDHAAGEFLHRFAIHDTDDRVANALDLLAHQPRRWLSRLHVAILGDLSRGALRRALPMLPHLRSLTIVKPQPFGDVLEGIVTPTGMLARYREPASAYRRGGVVEDGGASG